MRYLGIDFGSKRIGVALSDEAAEFVYPLVVLQNTSALLEEIKKIKEEYGVGAVVVGESKNFSMENNRIMEEVTPFVEKMQKELSVLVYIHPEFMTSQEAEKLQGKNDMLDASAAAIILKSFLDLHNNKKNF